MIKRVVAILSTLFVLFFAFAILSISFLKAASVNYAFYDTSNLEGKVEGSQKEEIKYYFAYPGKILPDSSLWTIKALRDQLWLLVTTNNQKKAELLLLFSDKRLISAKILFEKNKAEIAFPTLEKAEKYLERAALTSAENRKKGVDTTSFDIRLATASLKHRDVIENGIMQTAPEDAKPRIVKVSNYAKQVYQSAAEGLREKGVIPPENPFETI